MPGEEQAPAVPLWPGGMLLFVEIPGGWLAWTGDHADWLPCSNEYLDMQRTIDELLGQRKPPATPRG